MPMQCYVHVKSQFRWKKAVLPLRNFRLLIVPPGNTTTVTARYYPISSLLSVSGRLREVKNKENFKLLALKMVAVAYERWSLTRDSQCSDLAEKVLVFWKTGRWGEVVATGGSTVYIIFVCFCMVLWVKDFVDQFIFLRFWKAVRDGESSGKKLPLVFQPLQNMSWTLARITLNMFLTY